MKINLSLKSQEYVHPTLAHMLPADSNGFVSWVEYSPDGDLVATVGWDGKIRLWDPLSGQLLRQIVGSSRTTLQARFSPDESKLVVTSLDSTLRIWDILTGTMANRATFGSYIWATAYNGRCQQR